MIVIIPAIAAKNKIVEQTKIQVFRSDFRTKTLG